MKLKGRVAKVKERQYSHGTVCEPRGSYGSCRISREAGKFCYFHGNTGKVNYIRMGNNATPLTLCLSIPQ